MFLFPINKRKFVVSCIIGVVALVGDKNTEGNQNQIVSAIVDCETHGLIGAFTWLGMFIATRGTKDMYFIAEVIACGILSSLIDIDHFIQAKSLELKDAINLKNRPFFHCTSLAFLIFFFVMCISHILKLNSMYYFGWMLAAAFLSHHIRDSKRRGFWLCPFGSTPPTPTFIYVILEMFLPHILSMLMNGIGFPRPIKQDVIPSVEGV